MTKLLYDVDDVAAELKCSRQTVWRWIREGKFPRGKSVPSGQIWTRDIILAWASSGQATKKQLREMGITNAGI